MTLRFLLVLALPLLLLAVTVALPALAADSDEQRLEIRDWLILGAVPLHVPAFGEETGGEVKLGDLLTVDHLPQSELWPRAEQQERFPGMDPLRWAAVPAGQEGPAAPDATAGPALSYFAAYLETDRFVTGTLTIGATHLARVFVDGAEVAKKEAADAVPETEDGKDDAKGKGSAKGKKKGKGESGSDGEARAPGEATAELRLTPGVHRVVVATIYDPSGPAEWTVGATFAPKAVEDGEPTAQLSTRLDPRGPLSLDDLLDTRSVAGASVSADGRRVAVQLRSQAAPGEGLETWTEILDLASGRVVRSFRGTDLSGFEWGPTGQRYLFVQSGDESATIWVGDLTRGEVEPILRDVPHLAAAYWSPNGKDLFYTVTERSEPDDRGIKRLRTPEDRWSGQRDKFHLHQVSIAGKTSRRLTAGAAPVSFLEASPDGRRVLLSRSRFTTRRPFSEQQILELDLETFELKEVLEGPSIFAASYSPDGSRLLLLGGPGALGGIGRSAAESPIPNDYDTQAFIYDLTTREARALTRDLKPRVMGVYWAPHDEAIYVQAEAGPFVRLFRYRPDAAEGFEELPIEADVFGSLSFARQSPQAVFVTSSVNTPPRLERLDLASPSAGAEIVLDPGAETWERVELGEVEDFAFTTEAGDRIEGRVYLPIGFDPAATGSYPAIVYYYGGTAPTSRDFGGRYPKNLWAAQGYVVYVLQPSGTTGYGQAFADRHVNDWGQRVAGEILEGVDAFVAAYPAVDGERLGCIGASYGGFMTQLLITRSDRFAAAVSHAGISSIASYWGEGWWGYLYSAVATAESYPWNRPDLYTEQSPLFSADKITTPLLLLHGTADTNVPPGESEQMYIALKLLGKDVEYVRVEGENHGIVSYDKRKVWTESILAWFGRHLKGEGAWWRDLYGTDEAPKG